jgi:hypothetical protein
MGDQIFVLIPLTGMALAFYGIKVGHEQKMAKLKAQEGSADMSRLVAKLEQMDQRLQTLERLAVDPSARLASQIDSLRDARS